MRTGDWLAKASSQVAASFDDVDRAVKWLAERYSHVEQQFLYPDRVGLEDRISSAKDLLPRHIDVMWGWWLKGGRFASLAMVCCPNRDVDHPCPERRGDDRYRNRPQRSGLQAGGEADRPA